MGYKLVSGWAAGASVFIYSPRLQKIAEQYRFHFDVRSGTGRRRVVAPLFLSCVRDFEFQLRAPAIGVPVDAE